MRTRLDRCQLSPEDLRQNEPIGRLGQVFLVRVAIFGFIAASAGVTVALLVMLPLPASVLSLACATLLVTLAWSLRRVQKLRETVEFLARSVSGDPTFGSPFGFGKRELDDLSEAEIRDLLRRILRGSG